VIPAFSAVVGWVKDNQTTVEDPGRCGRRDVGGVEGVQDPDRGVGGVHGVDDEDGCG
jgi:hypothetical protein